VREASQFASIWGGLVLNEVFGFIFYFVAIKDVAHFVAIKDVAHFVAIKDVAHFVAKKIDLSFFVFMVKKEPLSSHRRAHILLQLGVQLLLSLPGLHQVVGLLSVWELVTAARGRGKEDVLLHGLDVNDVRLHLLLGEVRRKTREYV
jgi:hypothetical protein